MGFQRNLYELAEHVWNVLLETGTGERAASVVYDRAYSSFAQIEEEWNGTYMSCFQGVEIFHISGITAALSKLAKYDGCVS